MSSSNETTTSTTANGGAFVAAASQQGEAIAFLNALKNSNPPSKDALLRLSSVEGVVRGLGDSTIASLFLETAAKHLPAAIASVNPPTQNQHDNTEEQARYKQVIQMVAETCGVVATFCQPRLLISSSGILPVLAQARNNNNVLSTAHVEFLQCALLAGQYRFARRMIHAGEWPNPEKGTTSVQQVLRYFYLRGMIHIGCDECSMAIRCFWTTLAIPSDVISAIAMEAWKKMVLIKCLSLRNHVPYPALVAPPAAASNAVVRFLNTSSSSSTSSDPEIMTIAAAAAITTSSLMDSNDLGVPAYMELVRACHAGNSRLFESIRTKYVTLWEQDGNEGLVQQVATDMEHRHLLHLSTVYSTLPLEKLQSEFVDCNRAKILAMLDMVDGLEAKVEDDGMVSLSKTTLINVENNMDNLMSMAEWVRKMDVSIANSSRYQHIKGEASRAPRGVEDF